MRGARGGEAGRGGESSGNAAERRDDAAARQGSSGEVARATGCMGSTTNSMGVLLTFRRSSLATSRRRNDGGGKESKAAAARICGARASEGGGSGEGVQGAAAALNSPDGFLGMRAMRGGACSGRTRGRRQRSPGRRRHRVGDDGWTPSVSLGGRRRRWAGCAGSGRELRPAVRRAAAAGGVGLLRGLKRAAAYCWAG
jgi:hypothetical protein